jgi:Tfp pilus assembly protein PilW
VTTHAASLEGLGGDRGTTLVELLVTAVITVVLSVVAATVTIATSKAHQDRSESSVRTAAAKVATELLTRDLRDARSVAIDSPRAVSVWDDRNLDYRAQAWEKAKWTVDGAGRLCRTTQELTTRCVTASGSAVTFENVPGGLGGYRAIAVRLTAGPASPERKWSVALENLR